MTAIYGLYQTPQAAQRAFDRLRAAGIATGDITIMSSEPLEDWEFASRDRKTVMPWIAVIGAGLGLIAAYLLTSITQRAWPINTGGMPIVSNWTNIIILFELTMLGAVLATVLALLITARLPSKLSTLHDPAVSNGRILVGVERSRETALATIEGALRAADAETVTRTS
jgi:thiazole synthase ThiGH ThiG subunit